MPPSPQPQRPANMSPERYQRLLAEAQAPYRGLRLFLYGGFAASGVIGGFVFFFRVLAGRDLAHDLPNLALQVGLVALMVWLFRWEKRREARSLTPNTTAQNTPKAK